MDQRKPVNHTQLFKRILDLLLSILMILLMVYQLTGNFLHEWIGMAMMVVVILHNVMNRNWYTGLGKGRYTPQRGLILVTNLLLIISFLMAGVSGMAISEDAVPFLNGMISNRLARTLHLASSYWSMVLMSLHLGFHWGMLIRLIPAWRSGRGKTAMAMRIAGYLYAMYGLYVFIRDGIWNYLTFTTHFAIFDDSVPGVMVLFNTLAMMAGGICLGGLAMSLVPCFWHLIRSV